jgi:hypothetical protein
MSETEEYAKLPIPRDWPIKKNLTIFQLCRREFFYGKFLAAGSYG